MALSAIAAPEDWAKELPYELSAPWGAERSFKALLSPTSEVNSSCELKTRVRLPAQTKGTGAEVGYGTVARGRPEALTLASSALSGFL